MKPHTFAAACIAAKVCGGSEVVVLRETAGAVALCAIDDEAVARMGHTVFLFVSSVT